MSENPVEAAVENQVAPAPKKRRGRKSTKVDFLEENGIKSLTRVPSIPDEYDPEQHNVLKEDDFDDTLHYLQYKVAWHEHFANSFRDQAKEIEGVPQEARSDYAKLLATKDQLLSQIRKFAGNEAVNVEDVLAQLTTAATS